MKGTLCYASGVTLIPVGVAVPHLRRQVTPLKDLFDLQFCCKWDAVVIYSLLMLYIYILYQSFPPHLTIKMVI